MRCIFLITLVFALTTLAYGSEKIKCGFQFQVERPDRSKYLTPAVLRSEGTVGLTDSLLLQQGNEEYEYLINVNPAHEIFMMILFKKKPLQVSYNGYLSNEYASILSLPYEGKIGDGDTIKELRLNCNRGNRAIEKWLGK